MSGRPAPEGEASCGGRAQPFLWLFSGKSDSWVSTGLYIPNGQKAEVSLSAAAASAGLKVRPEHPLSSPQTSGLLHAHPAHGSAPRSSGREYSARFTDFPGEAAKFDGA